MNERTKMRKEFSILIDRCGCSRASLRISQKEIDEAPEVFKGTKPTEPHCTPKRCFPTLYSFLYPKGGFSKVSYMVTRRKNQK
jgi:hypothetical protein